MTESKATTEQVAHDAPSQEAIDRAHLFFQAPLPDDPDVDPEVRALFQREMERGAQERQRKTLNSVGEVSRREFSELLNTKANHLRGAEHAPRLAERHNSVLISDEFIILMEAMAGNVNKKLIETVIGKMESEGRDTSLLIQFYREEISIEEFYRVLLDKAHGWGYFLSQYSVPYQAARLESDDYVIYETERDMVHPINGKSRLSVADCQVHIPREDVLSPIFEMPQPGDMNINEDIVERILKNPATIAIVEDIVCVPHSAHAGNAGFARSAAFNHIIHEINPKRAPDAQITDSIAMIGSLRGIERPDGTVIMLKDYGKGSILNERSFIAHEKSRYETKLAYKLDTRRLPFKIGNEEYQMLTRWLAFSQEILHPREQK